MDIFQIFNYLNKLSFVAFIVTLGVIGYQIYQLKKDKTINQKEQITVPDFQDNIKIQIDNYTKIDVKKYTKDQSKISPLILIGMAGTFLLIVILAIAFYNRSNQTPENTQLIKYISSKGIKILDKDSNLLTDQELILLKPKDKINIVIETIDDPYIDKARIRVNQSDWKDADVITRLDDKLKGFIRPYVIATDEVELKIEAQLHSSVDGWLGN